MSHIEYEIVAALAFVCTVFFVWKAGVLSGESWRDFDASGYMALLVMYGFAFLLVLIGWFVVRTLILAVR